MNPAPDLPLELVAWMREACNSGEARRIRETNQISLSEAGRAVGVAGETINRWERGQRRPRADAAVRYARLLHRLDTRAVAS